MGILVDTITLRGFHGDHADARAGFHSGAIPPLPPRAPRARTHAWERGLARSLLRLAGWRISGEVPDVPQAVIIFAPHSSNWDGIWMYFAVTAIGLDVCIMGKPVLFKIPVAGVDPAALRRFPASQDPGNPVFEQACELVRDA